MNILKKSYCLTILIFENKFKSVATLKGRDVTNVVGGTYTVGIET